MKKITIVAFDKFTDIDVFLAWDLFNRIRLVDKTVKVSLVGTSPRHISVSGLSIDMHDSIDSCKDADIVYFSSGSGTRSLINDPKTLERFNLDPQKQIIVSICSGSLILAALGLLRGLTATTYPTAIEQLKSYGVEVVDKSLVLHDTIGTAAGCMAGIDLVGWSIEKIWGTEMKEHVLASVQPVEKGLACIY